MERISYSDPTIRRTRVLAGTGIAGAIVASSCCVLPLVFFVLGIGGAWMANLKALMPYKFYFMVPAVAAIIGAWVLIRREAKKSCATDSPVGKNSVVRVFNIFLGIKAVLVTASLLVIVSAMWPVLVPYLP
jgi:mercuric ion transport protein